MNHAVTLPSLTASAHLPIASLGIHACGDPNEISEITPAQNIEVDSGEEC